MCVGAAVMKNSVDIPQRNKNGTIIQQSNSTPRYLSEEHENSNMKRYMFIATLFTITKIWKQPKCTSIY